MFSWDRRLGAVLGFATFLGLLSVDYEILWARNASGQLAEKGCLRLKEWHMWGHMDTRKTCRRFSWQNPKRQVWGGDMPGSS